MLFGCLCTELTLFCTELTLFCTKLPENCIYLNQSELRNFSMYIIIHETVTYSHMFGRWRNNSQLSSMVFLLSTLPKQCSRGWNTLCVWVSVNWVFGFEVRIKNHILKYIEQIYQRLHQNLPLQYQFLAVDGSYHVTYVPYLSGIPVKPAVIPQGWYKWASCTSFNFQYDGQTQLIIFTIAKIFYRCDWIFYAIPAIGEASFPFRWWLQRILSIVTWMKQIKRGT